MTTPAHISRLVGLFEEALDADAVEQMQIAIDDREITAERALAWLTEHGHYGLVIKVCREALAGLRNMSKCEHCGKRLTGRRADAAFCSNACRQAAYRKRSVA